MAGIQFIYVVADVKPRTITHAVQLLKLKAQFLEANGARISIGPRLPASKPAWSFCLTFNSGPDNDTFAVLLPACATVTAISEGNTRRETFDINDLDEATVNCAGEALLNNGSRIRAIESDPVNLPWELSDCDWQILHTIIEMIDGQSWAYRSLRQDVPLKYQEMVPDHRSIDLSSLKIGIVERNIKIPPLKMIQYKMSERFQVTPALAKISDTLRKTGIRASVDARLRTIS